MMSGTKFHAAATVVVAAALSTMAVVLAQDSVEDYTAMLNVTEECSMAFESLMENTEVTSIQNMFLMDLLGACDDSADMACSYNFDLLTGFQVSMDACNMEQLNEYQEVCETNGYTFCSMSADINATVTLEDLIPTPIPVSIKPSCIGLCMPAECNPDELEAMSPFDFTLDFVSEHIEDAFDDTLGLDIEIDDTMVSMSFDCSAPGETTGVTIEEKGHYWTGRKTFRM